MPSETPWTPTRLETFVGAHNHRYLCRVEQLQSKRWRWEVFHDRGFRIDVVSQGIGGSQEEAEQAAISEAKRAIERSGA